MSWKSKLLGRMSTQLVACTLDELLGGCVDTSVCVLPQFSVFKDWVDIKLEHT